MNQKLRTARSSIVIILTLLCIVCLSLSLAFSAHFAAFAEESTGLPVKDAEGNYLWKVHYITTEDDQQVPKVDDLLDGKPNGTPITYLSNDPDGSICSGGDEVNYFVPFRDGVEYEVKLNGDYVIGGQKLSDMYDLEKATYSMTPVAGAKEYSLKVTTTVTVDDFEATKEWMIATLCNTVIVGDNYVGDRYFATSAEYGLVKPRLGNMVVYDLIVNGYSDPFAIKYDGEYVDYLPAAENGATYDVIYGTAIDYDREAVATVDGNLFNYKLRNLNAGNYMLRITALSPNEDSDYTSEDGIYYAAGSKTFNFTVDPQPIDNRQDFIRLFGGMPTCVQNTSAYTEDGSWINDVELQINGEPLRINGVSLQAGVDYIVSLADKYGVGRIDLRLDGNHNLAGSLVLENAMLITPAQNRWDSVPNITPWNYGDYSKDLNKIVGMPLYPNVLTADNINDITFSIVSVNNAGEETDIDGLKGFHYVIEKDKNDIEKYVVSDDVAAILAGLHVGKYRMYASVYGVEIGDAVAEADIRNYQPIPAASVDFSISAGVNSWESENGVPSIVSWTAGKYNPEVNTITATDRFGNEGLIIIRNGKGDIVYSNHPEHADKDFGDISVLKKFKAGYYTLQAEVKGTGDYNALNTFITFTIARNGLPAWAVIIIVAGSLGVVALIFGLLHQKGVLQMLTGKVIVSMRTRANVDATLAAIRAAKVAREAAESVAAAKAREAEEASKESKDENK